MGADGADTAVTPALPPPKLSRPLKQPRVRGLRTALLALLLMTVSLLLVLAGGAAWLWQSDAALANLAARVPGLSISGQQGRLSGGPFALQRLQWQGGRLRVVVDGLAWDDAQWTWRPHPGAWVGLRLTQPRAARLQLLTTPALPRATAPTDLRLPFELQAPGLRIARVEIDTQPPITALAADLHLGAAAGAEHRVERLGLLWAGLAASGRAVLGTTVGLPLQARLDVTGPAPGAVVAPPTPTVASSTPAVSPAASPDTAAWRAELQAQGPLARLPVQALFSHASGAGANAQATLAPFAAWPLLALAAQTHRLDLSSLALGLPQTALSGRAWLPDPQAVQSLQDPLALELRLENAEPGPWNARRLPLRRLEVLVVGQPGLAHPLQLKQLAIDLAGTQPAGRIEGSGRFHNGELALGLTVADLRPEQLFIGAAPMRLAGQLDLALAGLPGATVPAAASAATSAAPRALQTTLRVDLNARLPQPGSPPLSLQTTAQFNRLPDGTLSASLREVNARAMQVAGAAQGSNRERNRAGNRNLGSATGEASAERNTAGDWRLQTRGALVGFDPGPWWPAARLKRGAQALNARWQADLTRLATITTTTTRTPQPPAANWLPQLRGSASVDLDESRFADLDWRGQLSLQATAPALQARAELRAGANHLQLNGQWLHPQGAAAALPTGTLDLQVPALPTLAPLAALLPAAAAAWWPREGSLSARASAQGTWPELRSEGSLRASGLRSARVRVGQAEASWNLSTASEAAPLQLQLQASDVSRDAQRLDRVEASLQGSLREHRLQLRAFSPLRPPAWADALSGRTVEGGSELQLQGSGQWTAAAPSTTLTAAAKTQTAPAVATKPGAGIAGGGTWRGRLSQLRASPRSAPASPWLAADNLTVALTLASGGQLRQAVLDPGRVAAFGGGLTWQRAAWQAGATAGAAPLLELQAQIDPIAVAPLLARLQPQFNWRGDLALAGRIAISRARQLQADITVERTAGDLSLTIEGATRALEISTLRLGLETRNGLWQATQALVGRNVGVVGGLQTLQTTPEALWPEPTTPLSGGLSLIVPQLQVWAPWLPPGWRLGGALRVAAAFTGSYGKPEYRGDISGENLSVRNLFEGIHLQQGTLAVALNGSQAQIRQAEFRDGNGEGWLRLSGGASFSEGLVADLRVATEKLRLLDRYDRRITVSGTADLGVKSQQLTARGSFTIDNGLVDATQADAPKLSSDVTVRNRAPLAAPRVAGTPGVLVDTVLGTAPDPSRDTRAVAAQAPPSVPGPKATADVDLRVALGPALRLRGRGLDTLLRGELRLTTPKGQLAVTGVVRAEEGTYTAYGQNLRIARGNLIFSGALTTPQLDLLALRADIDQRVGVVVSGSAVNPRVRLYSEPQLGEFDALTWLVLGRAPAGLGRDDTALLQRAALALLAGERSGEAGFLQRLGLDELSFSRGGAGEVNDTIISLGKQISKRVYIGYEHALGAAGGTLQLIYRIADRITLRARTGTENAIDAVWTWRWN